MKIKTLTFFLAALMLALAAGVVSSCMRSRTAGTPAPIWTPAPVSGTPLLATRPAAILPTLLPAPTQPPRPTPTSQARPSVVATPAQQPTPEPTLDPHRVVITEADVLNAITSGATGQAGLQVTAASVTFIPDKIIFSAANLSYGPVEVRNLVLIGRLVARDGRLYLEPENITPRGLVTALIPTFANQALAQYTSQWYIEKAQTLNGKLELRIR
ncbi:MAG: hypothetical protein ACUVS6_01145 [Anaerolineae bacterium]